MNSFFSLLQDPAFAAILAAIISSIVAYWLHRKSRDKPTIIICEQQSEIQLIRFGLAEELPIKYGNEILQNAWIIRLLLTNVGSKVILEPSITFKVGESAKILKPRFRISPNREQRTAEIDQKTEQEVTINLDYLNPMYPHKETLLVDLICDGEVENLQVSGSGAGWSVQFKALRNALRIAFSFAIVGIIILVVSIVYFLFLVVNVIFNDPSVAQAISSLWVNDSIRFATLILVFGIVFTAVLALIAERKSKVPFYRMVFYLMPKFFIQQAINVIFRNRIL